MESHYPGWRVTKRLSDIFEEIVANEMVRRTTTQDAAVH
jgi:hypothetical protein